MAKTFSFDIESKFDLSAMINAVDQVSREITTRYDFGGTGAKINFDRDKNILELEANSELKVNGIVDVIKSKFIRANLDIRFLNLESQPEPSSMVYKLTIPLVSGLDQDKAKKISAQVRENFPKAKSQIQGESVRVTSASKDDLQAIMTKLKAADFDFPLSFTNFR